MWLPLCKANESGFHAKYLVANCVYYFYVTDFVEIWESQLSEDALGELVKAENPTVDTEGGRGPGRTAKRVVELLFERLSSGEKSVECAIRIEPDRSLKLHARALNLPLSLRLDFVQADSETFSELVVMPLLTELKRLEAGQKYLIDSLTKKDVEIAEYRVEGASMPFKHLITEKFDREKYVESKSSVMRADDVSAALDYLQSKFGNGTVETAKIVEAPNISPQETAAIENDAHHRQNEKSESKNIKIERTSPLKRNAHEIINRPNHLKRKKALNF